MAADPHAVAPSIFPSFPQAIRPPFPLGAPNDPIRLYTGLVEFTQLDKSFQAETQISLTWLPSPKIWFAVEALPEGVFPQLEGLQIRLDSGTIIRGHLTKMSHSGGPDGQRLGIGGVLEEQVVVPADGDAFYALFCLPNFDQICGRTITYPDKSSAVYRLVLSAGGWKITMDAVENLKEVTKFLAANGGFAVTQIGRLEKEDGLPFKAADAMNILRAFAWFCSFACGRWTGPCLPMGFDANDKPVWQVWEFCRMVPYRQRISWLDSNHGEQFEAPFPGFLKLWLNDDWEEVIRVAIHWYVEANAQAGSIEGSIILTQTAFELLASAVLVENHGWLSTEGYEKLSAADRIRLLFLWAGIPITIPGSLGPLNALAKSDNWPDTSTAMTMIRNTITHPTRKNRDKFGRHPSEARNQAWWLGLWNLELCLLRLFEYRGTYGNRITRTMAGEVEFVPWM